MLVELETPVMLIIRSGCDVVVIKENIKRVMCDHHRLGKYRS